MNVPVANKQEVAMKGVRIVGIPYIHLATRWKNHTRNRKLTWNGNEKILNDLDGSASSS